MICIPFITKQFKKFKEILSIGNGIDKYDLVFSKIGHISHGQKINSKLIKDIYFAHYDYENNIGLYKIFYKDNGLHEIFYKDFYEKHKSHDINLFVNKILKKKYKDCKLSFDLNNNLTKFQYFIRSVLEGNLYLLWKHIDVEEFIIIYNCVLSSILLKYDKLLISSYTRNLINIKKHNLKLSSIDIYCVNEIKSRHNNLLHNINGENISIIICLCNKYLLPSESLIIIFNYIFSLELSKIVYTNL